MRCAMGVRTCAEMTDWYFRKMKAGRGACREKQKYWIMPVSVGANAAMTRMDNVQLLVRSLICKDAGGVERATGDEADRLGAVTS
jgi:hypothetical protein